MTSILFVLNTTRLEVVETLSRAFVIRAEKRNNALIDFNTGDDVALLQQLDERRTVIGLLIESLVEEDHSRNMLSDDILKRKNIKCIIRSMYFRYCNEIMQFTEKIAVNIDNRGTQLK